MRPPPVELTDSQSVLVHDGRELIRLDRQRIGLRAGLVDDARQELLRRDAAGEPGFRFGFLLGVESDMKAPAARELADQLRRELVDPVGHCRGTRFTLSFLKAMDGPTPYADEGPLFAGYHLDTHPRIIDDTSPELLRVLVNLAPAARALRFIRADRFELAERGLKVPRSDFQVVDPPPDLPTSVIEIPALAGDAVSYLTFWASLVPHVGVERNAGHFLASFEALAHPWRPLSSRVQGA